MYRIGKQGGGEQMHVVTMDTVEGEDASEPLWRDVPLSWCGRKKAEVKMTSGTAAVYDLVTCDRCRVMLQDRKQQRITGYRGEAL